MEHLIVLEYIASLGFLAATLFTLKLSIETRGEKYWLMFFLAALSLGLHQWVQLPGAGKIFSENLRDPIMELGHIIGGICIAYASFGIHKTMMKIRKRVEN